MAACIQSDHVNESEGIHLNHTLNREKQVEKIFDNASRQAIEIEINNNEENVNIKCSPGFYNLVVKPCLLSVSEGFQITCRNVTFELNSITPHKDLSGIIQTTVLKFIYRVDLMQYGVTISLHHTTQLVQIQGGSKMSDGTKAASFVLNHVIADLFNSRSSTHKSEIDSFNAALLEEAKKRNEDRHTQTIGSATSSMFCSVCSRDMSKNNSKIVPCPKIGCFAKMHTSCFRKHTCPFNGTRNKALESSVTHAVPESEEVVLPQNQQIPSSFPSLTQTTSTSTFSFSSVNVTPVCSIPGIGSPPETFSFSRPAIQAPSSISLPVPPNSSATGSLQVNSRTKRARQSPSPESVQIEFYVKELSIVQTRITALESDIARKEETCKLLEERIKSLEHPVISNMFNRYIPNPTTSQTNCSAVPTVPCPSVSSLDHMSSEILSLRSDISCLSNLVRDLLAPQHNAQLKTQEVDNSDPVVEVPDNPSAPDETAVDSAPVLVPTNNSDGEASPHPSPKVDPKKTKQEDKKSWQKRKQFSRGHPKKPIVHTQPWLSSTVWDNALILPIPFSNEAERPNRSRRNVTSRRRQKTSESGNGNSHRLVSNPQPLGGNPQSGPVLNTVRNVWTSRGPDNSVSNKSPPLTTSPAEQVRSVWTSRFGNQVNNDLN